VIFTYYRLFAITSSDISSTILFKEFSPHFSQCCRLALFNISIHPALKVVAGSLVLLDRGFSVVARAIRARVAVQQTISKQRASTPRTTGNSLIKTVGLVSFIPARRQIHRFWAAALATLVMLVNVRRQIWYPLSCRVTQQKQQISYRMRHPPQLRLCPL
jgi:hypothetical protein